MRFLKIGGDDFVDAFVICFGQLSKNCAAGLQIVLLTEHRLRDFERLGPGEAYDADSSAAGRSGDCDDGIVEVHGAIVNWSSELVVGRWTLADGPLGLDCQMRESEGRRRVRNWHGQ